jgi:hypothetical protein
MPTMDTDCGDFSLPEILAHAQGGLPRGLTSVSHIFSDILHLQLRHGQFRGNHRFLGSPDQCRFFLTADDAGDLLEEVDKIVIDAHGIRFQGLPQLATLDEVGITYYYAGEIPWIQPIDRVDIPYTATIAPYADTGVQLFLTQFFRSVETVLDLIDDGRYQCVRSPMDLPGLEASRDQDIQ